MPGTVHFLLMLCLGETKSKVNSAWICLAAVGKEKHDPLNRRVKLEVLPHTG